MVRILIGSILGGLAQWVVGAIFWGTPLGKIAFHVVDDPKNAAVQQALAANLSEAGTGTYYVPWPDTAQGTVLHGKGPVALIHFNTAGFPVMDGTSLVAGLVLSILTISLLPPVAWLIASTCARTSPAPARARSAATSTPSGCTATLVTRPR